MNTSARRAAASVMALLVAGAAVLVPATAQAHSLTSSTIAVRVGDGGTGDGVEATVSVAAATLDGVLDSSAAVGSPAWLAEATAYLDDHLELAGSGGAVWEDTLSGAVVEQVEGISSLSVEVSVDTGGEAASSFTVAFDGVIEAAPSHEAVVVLTDAAGDISTPGVIDATSGPLTVTATQAGTTTASLLDMVGYGYTHVLAGADHLLFLLALLLPAPLAAVAGRWRRRDGLASTLRRTTAVVTCFTVGHLTTLVAASSGWVQLPSRPVEVLIAVSVGVAAVHAIRPLVRHGEEAIAGVFGLVHGLAFATILTDLGLNRSTSVLDLLAFNVGVEAAQLTAVALVLPSLYVVSRTRWYPALRVTGAIVALAAATGWALDRLVVLTNPLVEVEEAAVRHPLWVVAGLSVLAASAQVEHSLARRRTEQASAEPSSGLWKGATGP